MTREEALKVANEMRHWLKTDREKEALETLIPELKESKDERIIKTLQEYVKNRNWPLNGPTQDEALAWLVKQKECLVDNSKTLANKDERTRKEQKPAEWSEEDEKIKKAISYAIAQCTHSDNTLIEGVTKEEALAYIGKQYSAKWSEEDGAILNSVIRIITQFDDLAHEPTFAGPKWTHPYTKELNFLEKLRNRLFEKND